jgi:hypothetical protein
MTVPNNVQVEQPKEEQQEKDKRKALSNLIRERVMHALGKPANLREVQVKKLWADHYRVNVLVGVNPASIRVAHSYFVVIDEGGLVASTPEITKQY